MSNAQQNRSHLFLIVGLVIAISFVAIIALFAFVGWGVMTGQISDTKVLPGNKLPPRIAKTVAGLAGFVPGERITYFYSATMTPEGDGNLITDQRVISYFDDGVDARCDWIAIEDITAVHFDKSENWLEDSTIVVTSSDGTELTLYASNESDGDTRFVEAIRTAAKLDSGQPSN